MARDLGAGHSNWAQQYLGTPLSTWEWGGDEGNFTTDEHMAPKEGQRHIPFQFC